MANKEYADLELLAYPGWQHKDVEVFVLRLDSYRPMLSGNKFFKLKHNLDYIKSQGIKAVVSFGGAYSNHIHALAYAAKACGIQSVGIIRGEQAYAANPTLQDAQRNGMALKFVSREEYKKRNQLTYQQSLAAEYSAFVIPEGGSNQLALKGCSEIVKHIEHHINDQYDAVVLPCGTGATLAGVVTALTGGQKALGISVLKEAGLQAAVGSLLASYEAQSNSQVTCDWQILEGFHCGGYAKCSQALAAFVRDFPLPIEPIYSGKMFWALDELIKQDYFPGGSRVVAVHTGGLQGLRGMQPIMDKLLAEAV